MLPFGLLYMFVQPVHKDPLEVIFNFTIIGVRVMVFNTTFNNISVISWSVLLVEKTTNPPQVTDKLLLWNDNGL